MRFGGVAVGAILCVGACHSPHSTPSPAADAGTPSPNQCATGAGLDPDMCLLPWPSSAFLVADSTTSTGYRLQLPAEFMPVNASLVPIDPAPWNRWDGYSPMTTLVADFPQVLDPSPLPTWHDPGASLAAGSPTVIVDVDTGTLIAHFSEVESSPEVAAGHSTLYIRPATRLQEGHHYAVGIRGLQVQGGGDLAAPAPFEELRDGKPSLLESRRASFEQDVFAPLTAAGVDRSSLILAWDFRTGSGQSAWGDLLTMRDLAMAAAGPKGMACSVTSVVQDPTDPLIFRTIQGQFTVPNFLQTASDGSLVLGRDSTGAPVISGTTQATFTAIVPWTAVANPKTPAPLWVYGHGLLSDQSEVTRDFGQAAASEGAAVAAATDFTGLTLADQGNVAEAVEDLTRFPSILDQLRQGLINTLLLPRTLAGSCGSLPAFSTDAGTSFVSDTGFGYFGNSMGGTLGITVAAITQDMPRVAVGVGGEDFSVMMPRTTHWPTLEFFFEAGYPTRLDRDLLLVMSQEEWDVAESSAFAPHVLASPLAGSQPEQLMMQIGLYDADTTNIASEMAGRTLGLPELSPTVHAVWGLTQTAAPQKSAYVMYDMGAAQPPDSTLPPAENGVHEAVRRDVRAQAQLVTFLNGGGVIDTCDGGCGPIQPLVILDGGSGF